MKPILRRAQADRDVDAAADHYFEAAGTEAAFGFLDALEAAYGALRANPAIGSPRYGDLLDLPGLRHWRIKRFPFLILYVERTDHIDLWRVLHTRRDIPASIQEMEN